MLRLLVIRGLSMSPDIQDGQLVWASKVPYYFQNPQVGDIVAFWHPYITSKILIKRIISCQKNAYVMKGDSTLESTDSSSFGAIQRSDIIGKVYPVVFATG